MWLRVRATPFGVSRWLAAPPTRGRLAAIALPDGRKGEQIVLLTTNPEAQRVDLVGWAQNHGVAEIAVPRRIIQTETIPVLGTGKTDYVKVEKIILAGA